MCQPLAHSAAPWEGAAGRHRASCLDPSNHHEEEFARKLLLFLLGFPKQKPRSSSSGRNTSLLPRILENVAAVCSLLLHDSGCWVGASGCAGSAPPALGVQDCSGSLYPFSCGCGVSWDAP